MIYLQTAGVAYMEPGQAAELYNYTNTVKIEISCVLNDEEGNWAAEALVYTYDGIEYSLADSMYAEGYETADGDYLTSLSDQNDYVWNKDMGDGPFTLYSSGQNGDVLFLAPDPRSPLTLADSREEDLMDGSEVYVTEYRGEDQPTVTLWNYYTNGDFSGFEMGFLWEDADIDVLYYEVLKEYDTYDIPSY